MKALPKINPSSSHLKAEVVVKLDGVEDTEDGCRGGAADEEDDDGDEHQHQHPLLRALQGLHPPPPRPRPEFRRFFLNPYTLSVHLCEGDDSGVEGRAGEAGLRETPGTASWWVACRQEEPPEVVEVDPVVVEVILEG